jgi:hypothetical protein
MSDLNVIPVESLPELEDLQGAELAIVVKDGVPYRATLAQVAAQLAFSYGEKKTGVDAGFLGQISINDDYFYVCVIAGAIGVAVWKRGVLFQT